MKEERGITILCLDDNFDGKFILSDFFSGIHSLRVNGDFVNFEELDFVDIADAKTIKEALEYIKSSPTFDVWTLDYNLRPSDGTGLDFLRRVFAEAPDKIPANVKFHSSSSVGQRLMETELEVLRGTHGKDSAGV